MADNIRDAERLFTDFANRHSLKIRKDKSEEIDLLMTVPVQERLSFELVLGLQNGDEINIGLEKFWSYIFPFPSVQTIVSDVLDGLVTGQTRLAIHRQFNRDVMRVLEMNNNGVWMPAYRSAVRLKIPFIHTDISYLCNAKASSI